MALSDEIKAHLRDCNSNFRGNEKHSSFQNPDMPKDAIYIQNRNFRTWCNKRIGRLDLLASISGQPRDRLINQYNGHFLLTKYLLSKLTPFMKRIESLERNKS